MVDFNFTFQEASGFTSGVSTEQMAAFKVAGEIWSQYLKDDVIVNVHVGMSDTLPKDVIGGALPGLKTGYKFDKLKNKLQSDQISVDDASAVAHLRSSQDKDEFDAIVEGVKLQGTKELVLTTAQAKALNVSVGNQKRLNGIIVMSDLSNLSRNQDSNAHNDVSWDFGPLGQSAPTADTVDFLSVAIHELGHVLGFVSGIDDFEWQQTLLIAKQPSQDVFDIEDLGRDVPATPLDFFRYSAESRPQGINDLSMGGDRYFSVDGGRKILAEFATGTDSNLGGDGYQASHWKNTSTPSGIMVPTLAVNQANAISILDLRAFDAFGWNLADSLLGSDGKIQGYFILS